MELQHLRYVLAVAETRNFTRAAERCFVAQSALSHQIARLEKELGARLFDRTSRRVRLTPAGEALLPAARRCVEAAERAAADVAAAVGEIRGRLTIGVIPTVAAVDIPDLLREFHRRYPQVKVGLRDGPSGRLTELVRDGAIDLAFLGLPASQQPSGVHSHAFAEDRLVAVVAPGHPLTEHAEVDMVTLAAEVFVDFPPGSGGRAQSDQAFAAADLSRDVAFEVTTAELMAGLIRAELCIGLLSATFTSRLTGIATIPVREGPTRVEHLVWSTAGPTPAATAFLDLVGVAFT
ncbi:LysR substrate-binding domain-containing protein [Nocardia bovistercoris]|uniref:LysR family transcriptional regulator n=1 Tax=Nocardia bovistercoris TaxID=2785916 RepID=A0A931IA57_9NOCA|nr:LysR substrate-binding domain-containing protein [Nocardia bovistercoris]MBH0777792.1 LysR family transcriptional regulator [Nocardia bovistercoris]